MSSTDGGLPDHDPELLERQFESLRRSFYQNIGPDVRRLGELARQYALVSGNEPQPSAATGFENDIAAIAHRIRGAAAIFGDASISTNAAELERIVGGAITARSHSMDTSVTILRSIDNLIEVLARCRADFA
ncbi:MAG TPA: Hpt domain-containing protein [Steroidobacteraceae bacterium]|nr:Hpt domain-containing protein [Steroidobacteraceae bacterium]